MKFALALVPDRIGAPARRLSVRVVQIVTVTLAASMLFSPTTAQPAALTTDCYSGPGCLDPSFGNFGKVIMPIELSYSTAKAVAQQPDGKIVVAGPTNAHLHYTVARYNADGSLDGLFGSSGITIVELTATNEIEEPNALRIQPDGKIVVAGRVGYSSGVIRLNADGTLDEAFGSEVSAGGGARVLAPAVKNVRHVRGGEAGAEEA